MIVEDKETALELNNIITSGEVYDNFILLRGLSDSTLKFSKKTTRKDRKPRDSTNFATDLIEANRGKYYPLFPARNKSIFCATKVSDFYGTPHMILVPKSAKKAVIFRNDSGEKLGRLDYDKALIIQLRNSYYKLDATPLFNIRNKYPLLHELIYQIAHSNCIKFCVLKKHELIKEIVSIIQEHKKNGTYKEIPNNVSSVQQEKDQDIQILNLALVIKTFLLDIQNYFNSAKRVNLSTLNYDNLRAEKVEEIIVECDYYYAVNIIFFNSFFEYVDGKIKMC